MEGVEIQAKDSENQLLWKKKDGSLVNISTLSDSELMEQLDEELIVRKEVYAKKAELLIKAEQEI